MKWFGGSIPEAIQASKSAGSLFIVYIAGQDEESKKMESVWNDSQVSTVCQSAHCVAIKLASNSDECGQFSMIYPVVVVPSVFFIGNNGLPLEITGGSYTAADFLKKVETAVQTHKAQLSGASPVVPPGCTAESARASSSTADTESTIDNQAKVERAKQLIAQRQAEKAEEEDEKSKQNEKERRELGQQVLKAKQRKEETEAQEVQRELRRQKEDDKKARERVKEQIARDRVERSAKYKKEKEELEVVREEEKRIKLQAQQLAAAEVAARRSDSARLQFRLPDGSSITQTFPSSSSLSEVRDFITQHTSSSFGPVSLSTVFPRRVYTDEDQSESLVTLHLAPSAVLMVLPAHRTSPSSLSSPGFVGSILSIIISPLIGIWNFVYNLLFASPSQPRGAYNPGMSAQRHHATKGSDDDSTVPDETRQRTNRPRTAYKRRTPGSVSRQEGNIHKFSNAQDDESDDESATWNGNSTQQM